MDPTSTITVPASTAASTVAAPSPQFTPAPFPARSLGAGLLLAALAVAALVVARRRRRVPRLIEIVESASLGPKRSVVVARMGDELLVLGSSEGGITLLSTRAAPAAASPRAAAALPSRIVEPPGPQPAPASATSLLARLRGLRSPAPQRFETLLAESVEDVELRRKLAAGHVGSVE